MIWAQVMRRLREKGVALILITHKLVEAYALGDRISVLRLGRVVGDIPPERLKQMSEKDATDTVIRMMFGSTRRACPRRRDPGRAAGDRPIAHRAVDRRGAARLERHGSADGGRSRRMPACAR